MRNFPLLLLALPCLCSPAICHAKLGETEAQCIARYGAESDQRDNLGFDRIGDKSAAFKLKMAKGSFVMNVIFYNGIDARETITTADPSQGISLDQETAFLDSESAGQVWQKGRTIYHTDPSDTTYEAESWTRSDGATARCWTYSKLKFSGWGGIEVSTAAYASAQRELDRQNGAQ